MREVSFQGRGGGILFDIVNSFTLFVSTAGKQLLRVDKIKLDSLVPNSRPETFINVRGQSLTDVKSSGKTRQEERKCVPLLLSEKRKTSSFFFPPPGNVLADSIDNSITDDSLASLIQMPGGCVEQNLASITLPLIATLYLERTEGWESVGVQRKAEALRYIRRGEILMVRIQ